MNLTKQTLQDHFHQLLCILKQIECTLDKQHIALTKNHSKKTMRMLDANAKRIDKACRLKESIDALLQHETLPNLHLLQQKVDEHMDLIRHKMVQNTDFAHQLREQAGGQLRTIKQGRNKVLKGYFNKPAVQQSYYIDKRIGR